MKSYKNELYQFFNAITYMYFLNNKIFLKSFKINFFFKYFCISVILQRRIQIYFYKLWKFNDIIQSWLVQLLLRSFLWQKELQIIHQKQLHFFVMHAVRQEYFRNTCLESNDKALAISLNKAFLSGTSVFCNLRKLTNSKQFLSSKFSMTRAQVVPIL